MGSQSRRHSRPTLASLAVELGVSRTTISNAYNRPDQLSPQLRRRVLETAQRLGYAGPDPVARSLRTKQAGAVGLIFTETLSYALRDPAAVMFLEGLTLACEAAETGLLLVPAGPSLSEADVGVVLQAAVDGFVVYSMPDDHPYVSAVLRRALPSVVVDEPVTLSNVDFVGIDDEGACLSLGRHLVELGHRHIGVICSRLDARRHDALASIDRQLSSSYAVPLRRLSGLSAAFSEVGIEWGSIPVQERFDHTREAGAHAAAELLTYHPEITAIACTSDVHALGVLAELRRRNIDVPGDFSVTGFDDVPAAGRAGLTTIRQPMIEKGRQAGELLFQRTGLGPPKSVRLDTELVVRQTTGVMRRGA